jgi:hypothetical protein
MMGNFKDSLLDIFLNDEPREYNIISIDVKKHMTVHLDDREAVTIIEPNLETGPWIAGGAALRWYQNMPVGESDIDVFCKNTQQADALIDRIKSHNRFIVKYESNNATTIQHLSSDGKGWTIQIIKKRFFNSLEEVIDNFDITVCQIGTSGNEWILGDNTAKDIREHNLRMRLPLQPDAPKRLTKYWIYGYRPVPGLLDEIQNNPNTRWKFTSDEDYHNAF